MGLARIIPDITDAVRKVFRVPDQSIKVVLLPERTASVFEPIDFTGGLPLPRMNQVSDFPNRIDREQQMRVIRHYHVTDH